MNIKKGFNKQVGCYKLMEIRMALDELYYFVDLDVFERESIKELSNRMLDEELFCNEDLNEDNR